MNIYQPGILGDDERSEADQRALTERQERAERERAEARRLRLLEAAFHTVTVTTTLDDEDTDDEIRTVDDVTFNCTAPADADCRRYPECACEVFNWDDDGDRDLQGHPRVPGRECWLAAWFSAGQAVYEGEDADDAQRDDCLPAVDRAGHILHTFSPDEYVGFEFVEIPA